MLIKEQVMLHYLAYLEILLGLNYKEIYWGIIPICWLKVCRVNKDRIRYKNLEANRDERKKMNIRTLLVSF